MFRRLPDLRTADHLDEAGRAVRARHSRVRVVRPQQPPRRGARGRALVPEFMDRTFGVPVPRRDGGRPAGLRRARRPRVRYGCRWESTRREDDGLVLVTSDGEYRCRAAVFAVGVTEPWKAPIPGVEDVAALRGDRRCRASTRASACSSSASATRASRSRAACCRGRAQIVAGLAAAGRDRDPRPLAGSRAVSAAARRVRAGRRRRVRRRRRDRAHRARRETASASRRTARLGPGELAFEADDVIVATGFRTPLLDLPELGARDRRRRAASRR